MLIESRFVRRRVMSNVLIKSSNGTNSVGLETFMLSKRRIVIRGEINEDVAI